MQHNEVMTRSVSWIREHFGEITDLRGTEAKVIWVTVYRAMEVGLEVEAGGGTQKLLKDRLLNQGKLGLRLEEASIKLNFLLTMIPTIRESRNIVDSAILVETLKYGILDVTDKSVLRRAVERMFAKVDPMYAQPIPGALYDRPARKS